MASLASSSSAPLLFCLLAHFSLFLSTTYGALRNQSVQCDPTQMHVFFDFDGGFEGVVYARDHYSRKDCRSFGDGSSKLTISIPINVDAVKEPFCGVRLNQNKHEFSVQLLVNEMKDILVSGLKEFEVRCAYDLKSVTVQLPSQRGIHINSVLESRDEDPQTLIQGSGSGILPVLDMSMREGVGIEGRVLQTAGIGQEITMDIFLDETIPYDIFVYNCIAHDGSRWPTGTVTLIDENGCGMSIERVTKPPLKVELDERGIKHVYLVLRGFQFSTSDVVYFECQVRPCLHKCNVTQCQTIRPQPADTPTLPTLPPPTQISSQAVLPRFPRSKLEKKEEVEPEQSLSLVAKLSMHPRMEEGNEEPRLINSRKDAPALLRRSPERRHDSDEGMNRNQLCLPHAAMGVLLFIFASACLVCVVAGLYVWRKLRSEKKKDNRPHHTF